MSLEAPDDLDGIAENADGTPRLIVIDSTMWNDDEERWSRLLTKLRSYIGYVYGVDFAEKYPGIAPRDVSIEVICTQPPSERMTALTSFAPRGDESNRMAVHCTMSS